MNIVDKINNYLSELELKKDVDKKKDDAKVKNQSQSEIEVGDIITINVGDKQSTSSNTVLQKILDLLSSKKIKPKGDKK